MIIDITEEEREFLQRMFVRAEMFCQIGFLSRGQFTTDFRHDLEKIKSLRRKFIEDKTT